MTSSRAMKEMAGDFEIDVFGALESAFQKTDVGIVEFCESDQFCGAPLYPRQRVLLKLIWLEEMNGYEEDVLSHWISGNDPDIVISSNIRERRQRLIDEGYPHFREIMLIGGRRSGKGKMTGLCLAKKTFDLVMMQHPQKALHMDPNRHISINVVAAGLDQAKQTLFADYVNSVLSCKALDPYVDKVLEELCAVMTPADLQKQENLATRRAKVEKTLASIQTRPRAANHTTIRGDSNFAIAFDEAAHMMEGVNSKSSMKKVYDAAKPSLDQFKHNAMIFQNSSPYTKIGQFYENASRFFPLDKEGNLVRDEIRDWRSLAFQYPSWELYKDWEKDKRFFIAIQESPETSEAERLEELADPDTYAVEKRAHWAETVDSFLNADKVDQMYAAFKGERPLTNLSRAGYGPDVDFVMHLDPATTTANFGLAVAHIEHEVDRDDNVVPHAVFDLVHAWKATDFPDNTINFETIKDELVAMIAAFRPRVVSVDQYNSRMMIDTLRKELRNKGVGDVNIVERTATLALNAEKARFFKTAINLNLVHVPSDSSASELLRNECKFLVEKNGRVDKQKTGPVKTKDVYDCVAECTHALLYSAISGLGDLTPVVGQGFSGMNPAARTRNTPYAQEMDKYFSSRSAPWNRGGGGGNPARGRVSVLGRRRRMR